MGQVPSCSIAPPRSMGVWSRSGKDENITKITRRVGFGGVFTLTGREHPSVVTAAQRRREAGSEGQASRMRHALPDAVIHLHTDYALTTCMFPFCKMAITCPRPSSSVVTLVAFKKLWYACSAPLVRQRHDRGS